MRNVTSSRGRPNYVLLIIVAAAALLLMMSSISSRPEQNADRCPEPSPAKYDNEQPNRFAFPGSRRLSSSEPADIDGPDSGLPPNELGEIMILMYHHLGEDEGQWRRSLDNFRGDLEYLYKNGYRPITLKSYLSGEIDLSAGMTPVILTFDDGLPSQLKWEDGVVGEPHPETAVGILLDFAGAHPGFDPHAVFYLNSPRPFYPLPAKQVDETLNWLVENGFELGNHTHWHANLSEISDDEVRRVIAATESMISASVVDYRVRSLALPFGLWPDDHNLAVSGRSGDISYEHQAIMLVGARPAPSPFSQEFKPLQTPRIQASSPEVERWFEEMQQNPDRRYVSDGNTLTVAVRADREEEVDFSALQHRILRLIR